MGVIIQGFTSLIISSGLALYYSAKLALVGVVFMVFLNIVGYMEEIYLADEVEEDVMNVENSSMIVSQAVAHIRTIASLHIEDKFIAEYTQCILNSKR